MDLLQGIHNELFEKNPALQVHKQLFMLYGIPGLAYVERCGLTLQYIHVASASVRHAPRYCPTGQKDTLHGMQLDPALKKPVLQTH